MSIISYRDIHDEYALLDWDAWLPRRRWFVRRPGEVSTHLDAVVMLDSALVCCFVSSGSDVYFVPLSCELEEVHDAMVDGDGHRWFDALEDEQCVRELLEACLGNAVGPHWFQVEPRAIDRAAMESSLQGRIRLGSAEQTNSWAMCGDSFLKIYRRIEHGRNLDIEVLEALAGRRDVSVPRLRGVLEARYEGQTATLIAVQEAIPHERNAWEQACADVAALSRGEVGVENWSLLGKRVAELHVAMASTFGVEHPSDATRATFGMDAALLAKDVVAELADTARSGWNPETVRDADALIASFERIAHLFSSAAPEGVILQRVHGDLHLGQILSCGGDWTIIDFEGEPARPAHERAANAPAAKDVAGMLRSFDYACRAGLPAGATAADAQLARDWRDSCRRAFLEGYFAVDAVLSLWPASDEARSWLLDFHEAEKAFYELRYELRHRPDWMPIPLGGLLALA